MKLSQQILKKRKTPYQEVAEKYNVSIDYVTKIANGKRNPTKKVGLDILNELKQIANN